MPRKPELIIVDTNLWLSFLLKKTYSRLDIVLVSGHAILVFSEELLEEFVEVARRPKFKQYITTKDISELLETINELAEFFEVTLVEEDDFLLALAKVSNEIPQR